MSRIPALGFCTLILLTTPAVYAQMDLSCQIPLPRSLSSESRLASFGDPDDDTVYFDAGAADLQFLTDQNATLTGGVVVRRGDKLVGADTAIYDAEARSLHMEGSVRFEDPGTEIVSKSAEFAYDTGQIRFESAEFLLAASNSRGEASLLQISRDGTLDLEQVSYTTCPPGSNAWLLLAGEVKLDTAAGVGTARNVKLKFQGIPILYTPYLSFPIGDARKSGILIPTVGSAGRSGNEIGLPYYWNIRENYDATFSPRFLTDRGFQLGTEFRYLTKRSDGKAIFDVLANDDQLNKSRRFSSLKHRTRFNNGWRSMIDFRKVSDTQYFEDLGGSLSLASVTHLNRNLQFDFFGEHWNLFGQVQEYQTLDETLVEADKPYRRLPQLLASANYPDQFLGLAFSFDSELVNFDRETGVTGWRFNAAPTIALPVEKSGWFIRPEITLQHTRYKLENRLPGEKNDPNRTIPTASVDIGMILERSLKRSKRLIQTIEPRLLYVHIPFRDQTALPVFDTINPDLNFVQLYRRNRFTGVDRVGDTDQLSLGITTRVLNVDSGKELFSATIGRLRSLSNQQVTLPGEIPVGRQQSDYIAELSFLLYDHLNFDLGHQWGPSGRGTTQSEARLQYRPQAGKVMNIAYRFRRQSIEQADVSWSWPLSKKWNFVGRYNYSLRDNEILERFIGIEYESCCWGLRVVSRRFLSTRGGERDSAFIVQLVLKGMGGIGTNADKMLGRGILGYSSELN